MSDRRLSAWWLVGVFLLTLPAVTTRIYASDEVQYFAYLRSLWFDGDVSFENEYRSFYDRGVAADALFHETFLERTTETGRRINFATIGCAVLWSPFYAAADLYVRATGGVRDGYSPPYVKAVAWASACYGLLGLLIAARLAQQLTDRGTAAAAITALGTPLVFYVYVAPPMSHACSAFAVALFLWTWWHVRERWSAWGGAGPGLAAALMGMVREQDLFFVAGPVVDGLLTLAERWRMEDRRGAGDLVRAGLAAIVALGLGLLPQLAAYVALNGYPGPSRLVRRKMTWTAPHALEVLASPQHGLLVWTPLAAIAGLGLLALALSRGDTERARRRRRFGFCALVMIAAQVYVAGSVESWTVAGAFGQRRFVAATVLLTAGIGAALAAAAAWRATRLVLATALALSVWWNLGLAIQFGAGLMDRQRLEPARNAYVSFVELPRRLPSLVYRYLFDRASFYKLGAALPGAGAPASETVSPGTGTALPR
jgi:hypothetical protein